MAFANMLLTGRAPNGDVILSSAMMDMARAVRVSFLHNTFRINDEPFSGYGWGLLGRVMENIGQAQYPTSHGGIWLERGRRNLFLGGSQAPSLRLCHDPIHWERTSLGQYDAYRRDAYAGVTTASTIKLSTIAYNCAIPCLVYNSVANAICHDF